MNGYVIKSFINASQKDWSWTLKSKRKHRSKQKEGVASCVSRTRDEPCPTEGSTAHLRDAANGHEMKCRPHEVPELVLHPIDTVRFYEVEDNG